MKRELRTGLIKHLGAFSAALFMLVLFMAQAATAGLKLEFEIKDLSGQGPVLKEIHYYQDNFIKTISYENGKREPLYTITDCNKDIIYFIDDAQRTYYTKTFDEIIASMKKGAASLSQALKDMPPAMQAQFKSMLGATPGKAVVTETGQSEMIAGFKADKYLITFKDLRSEVWISPELGRLVSKEVDSSRLKKFQEAFRGIGQDMSGGLGKIIEAEVELMKKKGEEVKRIQTFKIMGTSSTSLYQLVSAKEMDLPRSEFQVPSGYKKVKGQF